MSLLSAEPHESKVKTFGRMTLEKLMQQNLPEPTEVIPGLLFEGASLLAGRPKLGKSWLTLAIALAVANGGKVLGKIPVEAGPVLYLALEDSPRRLQSRVSRMTESFPNDLFIETECPRMGEGGLEALEGWLQTNKGAKFIAVDTWVKFKPLKRMSNDDYFQDSVNGAEIQALALKYGVAILLVHHVRKMAAEDFLDTVSGSVGLTGSCDTVMVLDRKRQSHNAELMITGRDIDETQYPLEFNADAGSWVITSDVEVKQVSVSQERTKILDFLGTHKAVFTPKAVSEGTGLSHGSIKHLLRKLAATGQVSSDGRGGYYAKQ